VWLVKNSDRQADEPQRVEYHPAGAAADDGRPAALAPPPGATTFAAIVSRPEWLWGCEMGVNERGLAVANEAVFTRLPVARTGLTGMDLQRAALERTASADDALELIVELLARHPQGGRMSLDRRGPRYHSSFLIADPRRAWLLETAGELWAARRVEGICTISNALTLDDDFDRLHPRALAVARDRGWCRRGEDFSFRRAFGDPLYAWLAGAAERRSFTARRLTAAGEELDAAAFAALLRHHGGRSPARGLRMAVPCAHASFWPTRRAGQTTASLIARLEEPPSLWLTGTSSPCLSVFKPLPVAASVAGDLPPAPAHPDRDSLWWRHERLHRLVLADYARRRAAFESERAELEARALATDPHDAGACRARWREHHAAIPRWQQLAAAAGRPHLTPFARYWHHRLRAAGEPEEDHSRRS